VSKITSLNANYLLSLTWYLVSLLV